MTTAPRYKVTITNQTRGWSYDQTHQQYAGDVDVDTLPDVLLADELSYEWGFEGDQLPGKLEPPTAAVRLWARNAAKLPVCEKGDRLTIDVRLGTAGLRILAPAAMKVTAADISLSNHPQYAAQLAIRVIEGTSELPALQPFGGTLFTTGGANAPSLRWRTRFAELAKELGKTIAAPTWWIDDERPLETTRTNPAGNILRGLDQPILLDTGVRIGGATLGRYPYSAAEALQRLLNAHHPSGIAHALMAGWQTVASTFPTGYRRVGPDNLWYGFNDANASAPPIPAFAEPQTSDRLYIVPASRAVTATTTYLPLAFSGGAQLTLIPLGTGANPRGHRPLAIDAAWCVLPATFRKAREHAPNVVYIKGQETIWPSAGSPQPPKDGARGYANLAAQSADGAVTREVDTALDLGTGAGDYHVDADRFHSAEADVLQAAYLTDDSQRVAWTPDAFTVALSLIPDALVEAVAPRICPRQPGETDGDGQVVRHATVYRLPDSKRFSDGQPVTGFVVRGSMRISKGDVVWTLNLTPGLPRYIGTAPTPITVGQVDSASYQAQQLGTIDPRIRIADLAYVAQ